MAEFDNHRYWVGRNLRKILLDVYIHLKSYNICFLKFLSLTVIAVAVLAGYKGTWIIWYKLVCQTEPKQIFSVIILNTVSSDYSTGMEGTKFFRKNCWLLLQSHVVFSPPGDAKELKLRPFDPKSKTTSDSSNRFFRKITLNFNLPLYPTSFALASEKKWISTGDW